MIYTFRYIGNKFQFLQDIHKCIFSFDNRYDTFVDVFGGSGVVSLNCARLFEHTILNDINSDIMCVHNTFKNALWSDYCSFVKRTHIHDLDLSDKETYYKFRDKGNKEFYEKNNFDKGWFLYFIGGASINSFFRVGPNGFNQSAANQDLSRRFTYMRWRHFKRAYENVELRNQDYKELCLSIDKPCTWFLDPPYFSMSNTYTNNFSKSQKEEFLDIVINHLKGNVIYTDAYVEQDVELLKKHGFKVHILRSKMPPVKAGKTTEQEDRIEVMYYKQKHNI